MSVAVQFGTKETSKQIKQHTKKPKNQTNKAGSKQTTQRLHRKKRKKHKRIFSAKQCVTQIRVNTVNAPVPKLQPRPKPTFLLRSPFRPLLPWSIDASKLAPDLLPSTLLPRVLLGKSGRRRRAIGSGSLPSTLLRWRSLQKLVVHRRKQACSGPVSVNATYQRFAQEDSPSTPPFLLQPLFRQRYSRWGLLRQLVVRRHKHTRSRPAPRNATTQGFAHQRSCCSSSCRGVVVVTVVPRLLLPHFLRLLLRLLPFLLCMHGGTPAAWQALSLRLCQVDSRALTGRSHPDTRRTRTTTAKSTPLFPLGKFAGRHGR